MQHSGSDICSLSFFWLQIEHIIQASDVSHTMQHWHIYRKWNKKLFEELYLAFQNGRMAKDPAEFWYQGELGFFDNYIIPLAKKLKDCNVFGVSSDECLNYALENRAEWQERGQEIVREMHLEVLGRTPPPINDYQTVHESKVETPPTTTTTTRDLLEKGHSHSGRSSAAEKLRDLPETTPAREELIAKDHTEFFFL